MRISPGYGDNEAALGILDTLAPLLGQTWQLCAIVKNVHQECSAMTAKKRQMLRTFFSS